MIIYFALIPITAAILCVLFEKISEKISVVLAVVSTLVCLCLSIYSFNLIKYEKLIEYHMGGWITPLGINLVMDSLSVLMLITINVIGFVVTLYSIDYIKKYTSTCKYYSLLLFLLGSLNGIVLAGDIFNMYVFIELASLASYVLVAFGVQRADLEASIRYQIFGTVGSLFILLAIGFIYGVTSTLDLLDIKMVISQNGINPALKFSVPLLLFGFSLKAGLVPFHAWLPDAHPTAPAPISAILSGLVIKTLGLYGICRIFFMVFGISAGISQVLLYGGLISIFFGAFVALKQNDMKRMLAYSSVSQIGYIMLGLGLGSPIAIAGALLHILNHATFKSLYFLCAGSVEYATGTRSLKDLRGISEKMPVTSVSSLFASFSLAGVPPFGGFWSKLLIIVGAIQAGNTVVAILAAVAGVITLAYFLKIQREAFFSKITNVFSEKTKEVPIFMCISMVILSLMCLGMGVGFTYVLNNVVTPATNVLMGKI
jgi:multicomponent Na+:H+ antiporter subunit D